MHRIVFVTPFFIPFTGGTTAFVDAMTRRLAAAGQRVTVLTTDARRASDFWQPPAASGPSLPAAEARSGIEIERLRLAYPWPAPYAFGLLRRAGLGLHRAGLPTAVQRPLLRRLAASMPPLPGLRAALDRLIPAADVVQVVESSWDGLFTAAVEAARRHGIPCVATPLMHLGDAGVRAHFQMAHQADAYRAADVVLALSQREAAGYVSLGVAAERVRVIPMGVEETAAAVQDATSGAVFRRTHGITGPLVAFLGANTSDKGAFTLALAVAQLTEAGAPVTAVFAGPHSELLAAFMARQPARVRDALRDHVRILGLVDEESKHAMLAACDLLALPSQVDTFGIVLLEAWLHGKPVIGADAGGLPELIHAEENGLLTPFGDAPALAAAIRRLVEAPSLAARLGAAGRRRTLEEYTWDRTYGILADIYAEVRP